MYATLSSSDQEYIFIYNINIFKQQAYFTDLTPEEKNNVSHLIIK